MDLLSKLLQLLILFRIFLVMLPFIIENTWFEYVPFLKSRYRYKWLEKTDLTRVLILCTALFMSYNLPKTDSLMHIIGFGISLCTVVIFIILTWSGEKLHLFFTGKFLGTKIKSKISGDKNKIESIYNYLTEKKHLEASLSTFIKLQTNQRLENDEKLIWTSVAKVRNKSNKQSLLNLMTFLFPDTHYNFRVEVATQNFLDLDGRPFVYSSADSARFSDESSKKFVAELKEIK